MSLQIASIEAADIPELVRLNGVVQNHHVQMRPDIFRADWQALVLHGFWLKVLEDRTSTVALARSEGVAVGYVWLQVHEIAATALKHSQRRLYVHQIAVQEGAPSGRRNEPVGLRGSRSPAARHRLSGAR